MLDGRGTFDGFLDRTQAGNILGNSLLHHRGRNPLILGIARGGVPVAVEVARLLDAELDIVVARKLLAPSVPEVAVGAVTANGAVFVNHDLVNALEITSTELQCIIAHGYGEARRRTELFRGGQKQPLVAGRVVIVVDDGLASGATMKAALRSVASQGPAQLIAAVPVGALEACDAIAESCDSLLCLVQPDPFIAVGHHYQHFDPVSDEAIEQALKEAGERRLIPAGIGS